MIKLEPIIMAKFHDFLVEYAIFPFSGPLPNELRSTGDSTNLSDLEVGLFESV